RPGRRRRGPGRGPGRRPLAPVAQPGRICREGGRRAPWLPCCRSQQGPGRALVARTRERHAAVHDLLAAGHTQAGAARILDLDPDTVHRYASQPDIALLLVKATSRDSRLDPFKPWITRRWNEGVTSAAALHAEMAATLGWAGGLRAVQRYVAQFRPADGRTRAGRAARPAPPAPAIPKTARSPAGC